MSAMDKEKKSKLRKDWSHANNYVNHSYTVAQFAVDFLFEKIDEEIIEIEIRVKKVQYAV